MGMLYETFNSLKETHGQDYFASEIDDEEYGVSEEDKKINKEFYANK